MRAFALLPAAALVLAGCGSKSLTLPDEPVERAATCGVIALIAARAAAGAKGQLPFDAQLGVLHYAMIEGASGQGFDRDRVTAISMKMTELVDPLTNGEKWKSLQAPCAEAYPATQVAEPKLPGKAGDAQVGCYVLADFVDTAMRGQQAIYGDDLSKMSAIKRALDPKIGARFSARGEGSADAQSKAKDAALVSMTKAGPPAKLLKQCEADYVKA